MRGKWRQICLCLCLLAMPLFNAHQAEEPPAPALRAILISSDRFVTMPETTPSSFNNVVSLRRALMQDQRGYQAIQAVVNRALGPEAFASLASGVLGDAREQDISLIYFSSHGLLIPQEGRTNFALLLSDGEQEAMLDSRAIYEALKDIKGTKVLILDACFSGAAIHKGDESLAVSSLFSGSDFKVLTSSGAREPSFLWTDPQGAVRGGSYFAQTLVMGIGKEGGFAADSNRDGLVTLTELFRHQRLYYGASSPQIYPENDPFPVFSYPLSLADNSQSLLTGLSLESQLISLEEPDISFSYTLHQPSRVAYQLVYQEEDSWRFDTPQIIAAPGEEGGLLLPGRKSASLQLGGTDSPLSGYLLMLLTTVEEDRAFPHVCPLVAVRQTVEDPGLMVAASRAFAPERGEEASFFIRHQGPCALTATIRNEEGALVASLLAHSPTRPLHLAPEGSTLHWNGLDNSGNPAPGGRYTLVVTTTLSGASYSAESPPVRLIRRP